MGLFDAGARHDRPATVHDRVVTVANGISLLRLLGLPVFVYLMVAPMAYGMATLTLTIVGTTDWIDGYVARRFDQVTKLGKVLDPLIDRALLATTAITLLVLGIVPVYVVALILARDVILLGVAYAVFRGIPPIGVTNTGKFATACLLIGVPAYLVAFMDFTYNTPFAYIAYILTPIGIGAYYVAGYQYARAAAELRRSGQAA